MKSILILLHCESNTGYAIAPLELTFFRMAATLCGGDLSRIHFGYPSMQKGPTTTLPPDFTQYIIVDAATSDPQHCERVQRYLEEHDIDTIFGFDQPVSRPIYKYFRRAGVRHFISYWGAPMSSIFGPFKRTLKRIEVALRRGGPDHYIFESNGMADAAVLGRGIPRRKTSVINLGIDTERFKPNPAEADYARNEFGIPAGRRIFFYAGHMEERKGVAVIMRAANKIAATRQADDWQFLLFGNQPGEETRFLSMLSDRARSHVIFGGYRHDLPKIHRGCYAAIIASTGWDSYPRSGLETQASGLPLLVSDLLGLREVVAPDVSGLRFPTNDDAKLAELLVTLLDQPMLRDRLSKGARHRIETELSIEAQQRRITETVARVINVQC